MVTSHRRPLLIGPRQYMVEFPRAHSGGKVGRYYCLAVFDNGGGGTVIGARFARCRRSCGLSLRPSVPPLVLRRFVPALPRDGL